MNPRMQGIPEAMPSMKSDERSQATGSQSGLLPKNDETMKMVGSSKDTAQRLMKAADGTPVPHDDDDEEFEDPSTSARDSGKVSGKVLDGSSYGKAGRNRRGVRRQDSDDGKIGVSPDQNRGQATDKYNRVKKETLLTKSMEKLESLENQERLSNMMRMKKFQKICSHYSMKK